MSVLARYTLTRNAGHRLQFDALGGLTLAYGRSFNRGTQTDSLGGAPRTLSFASHPTQLDLLLTAGVGMRYRLSPRFELFYDLTLNRALTGPPRPFSLGNAGSQALGLRFRFGH